MRCLLACLTCRWMPWLQVGGYLVNPASIPIWLRWLRYLSPMSFAFEAMFANEFRGQYYNFGVQGYEVCLYVRRASTACLCCRSIASLLLRTAYPMWAGQMLPDMHSASRAATSVP
jgi:hypothetical protein